MIKNTIETFSITNTTSLPSPRVPFEKIKDAVLGKSYSLSLVFIGEARSRKLNRSYRDKDKATNILSFPYDKKSGEIFITPAVARREAKDFDRTYDNFVAFLFIHGLLHLKGMQHGSRMERAEEKLRKKFNI